MNTHLEIIVRQVLRRRTVGDTEAGRKVMALLGESIDEFRSRSRGDRSSIVRRIARQLASDLQVTNRHDAVGRPALDTTTLDPLATIALS